MGNLLADLYVIGMPVVLSTGNADSDITIWMQKLNAVENEKAVRIANAERARVILAQEDVTADAYAEVWGQVETYDFEAAVDFILRPQFVALAQKIEARLMTEEPWSKDGFIQGIFDAWEAGLKDDYIKQENPGDNEDAQRAFDKLQEFRDIVNHELEQEQENLRSNMLDSLDHAEAKDQLAVMLFEMAADMAWMDAFQKAQVLFSCRIMAEDGSHREYLFETAAAKELPVAGSIKEIDELQDTTRLILFASFRSMTVEVTVGKDSQETLDS